MLTQKSFTSPKIPPFTCHSNQVSVTPPLFPTVEYSVDSDSWSELLWNKFLPSNQRMST